MPYQTFNELWQKEMSKLPKKMLIQIAATLGKEKEAAKLEGVLVGLKTCKDLFAQGLLSDAVISDYEKHYSQILEFEKTHINKQKS